MARRYYLTVMLSCCVLLFIFKWGISKYLLSGNMVEPSNLEEWKTLEFRLFGLPFAYIDINISLRQIEYRKHDYIYREIEALER